MPTTARRISPRDLTRATASLVWSLSVLVGAPVALATLFELPLRSGLPTWDGLTSTPLRFVDPAVILDVVVAVTWVVWFVVTLYVIVDLLDAVRGLGRRAHRIGFLGRFASHLVGSLMLLTSIARPASAEALPPPLPPPTNVVSDMAGPAPTSGPVALHVPNAHESSKASTDSAAPARSSYVVQRGDSLWSIAEGHLGDGLRWTEIHDLNRDLIADPDLIHCGWELRLPDHVSAAPSPHHEFETDRSEARPPDGVAPEAASPESTTPAATTPEADESSATGPIPEIPSTTILGVTEARIGSPTSTDNREPDAGSARTLTALHPVVPGITGATVAATGLLLALRRRRRRRPGPLRARRPTPLERTVIAAADLPLVRWVGQELGILAELIAGRHHPAVPVAVEFSEDSGIEVLWDQPFTDAPAPWEEVPGAWAWRTLYDPAAPVPVAERPSPVPALVTVGQRGDRQLMVNLEALGTVAIIGDHDAVRSLVRAMVIELATCEEIAGARVVITSGLDLDDLTNVTGIETLNADIARQHIETADNEAIGAIEDLETQTTFGFRTYTKPILPFDVTVVVAAQDSLPPTDMRPHRGAALIIVGDSPQAASRIVIDDETARLEPLGLRFTAASFPTDSLRAVEQLLADDASDESLEVVDDASDESLEVVDDDLPDFSSPAETPDKLVPWWLDAAEPPTAASESRIIDLIGATSDDTAAARQCSPMPRLLVKVLGRPRLVGGPQLGRRELAVVAYVASSQHPVTHEHIQDAIWGGTSISSKTVFNLIGSARSALGSIDGEPVLSAATRPQNTMALHSAVRTDLQRLRDLTQAAETSPSHDALQLLTQALELVEGPPFDAAGYDWAISDQLVSEAEHLIERAAATAAELALDSGDTAAARWAVIQGLRALPGDEILYRVRMRIELAAGNTTGARRALEELASHLEEYGEEPSEETTALLPREGSPSRG